MGELWVEKVDAGYEGEGRREDSDGEGAVAGEDAPCQSGDADVEETGGEGFRGWDEGFHFAFNGAFDVDPRVDERTDGVTGIGGEGGDGASCRADLTFEFGLNRDRFDLGIWQRVDRELLRWKQSQQ